LPRQEQERYQEEWLSHLEEVPGEIGRLVSALSLQVAALRIEWACLKVERAEVPAEVERAVVLDAPPTRRIRQNLTLGLLPEKKLDWRKFAVSFGVLSGMLLILVISSTILRR
jgi:hypothetical protein